MKAAFFFLKDPLDIEDWYTEALDTMDQEDLDHIGSLRFYMNHMEEFIFSSDEMSDKFYSFMEKERSEYQSMMH